MAENLDGVHTKKGFTGKEGERTGSESG